MRKSLFVLLVAMIALLAMVVSAYASYPPHGMPGDLTPPFFGPVGSEQPDGCAGCHRAHTAVGERLAFDKGTDAHTDGITPEGSKSAFCLVCHGISGNLANTNVVDGIGYALRKASADYRIDATGPLNGGGFSNMTSAHEVDGTARTVWGGGDTQDDVTMTLECGNCHDPHGTPQYRLLKTDVDNDGNFDSTTTVTSRETGWGTSGYTPDFNNPKYKKPANANVGSSASCWYCHKQYKYPSSSYNQGLKYRHKVNIPLSDYALHNPGQSLNPGTIDLPLEKETDGEAQLDSWMGCLSCHKAHGTEATMTDNALVGPAASSALLRMNNRGVCEECHWK